MSDTTHRIEHHTFSTLYLAFELGNKQWKLGFTIGLGQRPRERTIAAGDLGAFQEEIRLAKKRFELPQTECVMSCYEAGRDGFWLHRYLLSRGIENLVVDSASIEVNRINTPCNGMGFLIPKSLQITPTTRFSRTIGSRELASSRGLLEETGLSSEFELD